MKAIIRIPTEQYSYIEVQFEGTETEILDKHFELTRMYKNSGVELARKDFNLALDTYLATSHIDESSYSNMSFEQKMVIQEIKKSFARFKSKEEDKK